MELEGLGGEDLQLDGVETDAAVDYSASIMDGLGLGDIDFEIGEDSVPSDMTDVGSDLEISLDSDDLDMLDSSMIISSEVDISSVFVRYYEQVNNIRNVLFATSSADSTLKEVKLPRISEFSYIANAQLRQEVYRFFVQMMRELISEEKYSELSEEDAFAVLLDELYSSLNYSPSIYTDKMRKTFSDYYERSKKIVLSKTTKKSSTIDALVDKDRIDFSYLVFEVNSVPFTAITGFSDNISNLDNSSPADTSSFGDLVAGFLHDSGKRSMTDMELFECLIKFLSSSETLDMLGLPASAVTDLSTGEIVRRYLAYELTTGEFYPKGIEKINVGSDSITQIVEQLVDILIDSIKSRSVAAEVLALYTYFIIRSPIKSATTGINDSFEPFVRGIVQYLKAFVNLPTVINPVFYSLVENKTANMAGEEEFTLGFAINGKTMSIRSKDILCDAIGDLSSLYIVPFALSDSENGCIICPPMEVVSNMKSSATTGNIRVTGGLCYRYTPTFNWISSLNLMTANSANDDSVSEDKEHTSNSPLLNILYNYDNKFYNRKECSTIVTVKLKDDMYVTGSLDKVSGALNVCEIKSNGSRIGFEDPSCFIDSSDDSFLLKYVDSTGETQVLTYDSSDYETESDEEESEKNDHNLPSVYDFFHISNAKTEGSSTYYLQEVAKKVCSLSMLDYSIELEKARKIITRDLAYILDFDVIDRALGAQVLLKYKELFSASGTIDSFNWDALKMLAGIVYQTKNPLAGCEEPDTNAVKKLFEQMDSDGVDEHKSAAILSEYIGYLNSLNLDIIAFQMLSKSELSENDKEPLYRALMCIPEIRHVFVELENKMVILSACNDIGSDAELVFSKCPPLRSTFIKPLFSVSDVEEESGKLFKKMKSIVRKNLVVNNNVTDVMNMKSAAKARFEDFSKRPEMFALSTLAAVIATQPPANASILKYFALAENVYEVLVGLEESLDSSEEHKNFSSLYYQLKEFIGLDRDVKVSDLPETEFNSMVPREVRERCTMSLRDGFGKIIIDGLIAEIGEDIDIAVIKSYNLMCRYGIERFKLTDMDVSDASNYYSALDDFYKYAGSFFVTYSPVIGEGADEIDGGLDRAASYLSHRDNFKSPIDLKPLEYLDLVDLNVISDSDDMQVENASEDEAIGGNA